MVVLFRRIKSLILIYIAIGYLLSYPGPVILTIVDMRLGQSEYVDL